MLQVISSSFGNSKEKRGKLNEEQKGESYRSFTRKVNNEKIRRVREIKKGGRGKCKGRKDGRVELGGQKRGWAEPSETLRRSATGPQAHTPVLRSRSRVRETAPVETRDTPKKTEEVRENR